MKWNPPFQGVSLPSLLGVRRPLSVLCDHHLDVSHERCPESHVLNKYQMWFIDHEISVVILSLNKYMLFELSWKEFSVSIIVSIDNALCWGLCFNKLSSITRAAKMATLEADAMARRRCDTSTSQGADREISPTISAWNVYKIYLRWTFDIWFRLNQFLKNIPAVRFWHVISCLGKPSNKL